MAHETVRNFYRILSRSQKMIERYELLTNGWFGYKPEKIVAFAAQGGHEFTVDELNHVRRTNVSSRGPMGARSSIKDVCDYSPSEHPEPPFSAEEFRATHNRKVG